MDASKSFLDVMGGLEEGDSLAAAAIHERFVAQLIQLARNRLGPQLATKYDADDIVQSVFRSFYRRHADGQFQFAGWNSLWGLLGRITIRKCGRCATKFKSAKRDVSREIPIDRNDESKMAWELPAREPWPEEVVALEDTVRQLLTKLDPDLREVVVLKLQGYSNEEIGFRIRRTERTVYRVLNRVRESLMQMESELT